MLYRLVYHYRNELEWSWAELLQSEYGALRDEVLDALDKYLNCGILIHGCARAVCENCNHSELIAFSCKRRCLCSSCDAKRAVVFAENLVENVLPLYPISHQVYTIPKRLRPFSKFNRALHKHLYQAAFGAWADLIEDEFPSCQSGAAMALHTSGDLLNFHPHIHSLTLHGAFDSTGIFHELTSIQSDYLTRSFQTRVLDALKHERLIDQDVIDNMLSWENSGFHVFVGEPIQPTDKDARLFVARYLKKCPVSLERLRLIESAGNTTVRYHKPKTHEFRNFTPLKFLAEVSQHIPDKWEQTTRYFGTLSARTRGAKRLAQTISPLPEPITRPSQSWAACMKRVFELNPLICPKCGSTMKIKAFITAPSEIARLCKNLGLIPWRAPPTIPRNTEILAA